VVGVSDHVLARWSEHPYTSHDKRGWEVQHRVVIIHYGAVGADVRHEVRSADDPTVSSEWGEREAVELRDNGMRAVGSDTR
jgi:hypothetical protein